MKWKQTMNKVIIFIKGLSWKQICLSSVVLLCLLCWGGLTAFATVKKNGLLDQNAAKRWAEGNDAAQISCFFTESTEIDKDKIRSFEHELDKVLLESRLRMKMPDYGWMHTARPGRLPCLPTRSLWRMWRRLGSEGIFSCSIRYSSCGALISQETI